MKTLKVIGNCCFVFLAIIGLCVSLAYGYYHFFVKDVTTGTNYIDNQIALDIVASDDLTEEQKMSLKNDILWKQTFLVTLKIMVLLCKN